MTSFLMKKKMIYFQGEGQVERYVAFAWDACNAQAATIIIVNIIYIQYFSNSHIFDTQH